ncbi:hypothetical protein D0Z07_1967 [Hyphodiscus hymeniophilus]|uniref:Uncharacterized protein n=1 Tax=Hyphodiscus hymeniophilus TaxID=353542 RepID=A0A9P6VQ52_9HELO|nr:hypothetical protein D0Z07_1967 [Hyphodiscus hymeniophilus]
MDLETNSSPHTITHLALKSNHGVNVQVHQVGDVFDQKPLVAEDATARPLAHAEVSPTSLTIPSGWKIQEVDGKLDPRVKAQQLTTAPPPPLGVLTNFNGNFAGSGFNLIFRPNSGPPTTTTFPNAVSPAPPAPPSENVLELNLTKETLTFSNSLGSVPNRGLEKQNDIFLNGVPYVQSISDVTNIDTGKPDGNPTGIHFEPGLWMHVPSTTTDPTLGESLVRMASIPHGTTINAQCLAPVSSIAGPPGIPSVDITPFVIGSTQQAKPVVFASQTASNTDTPRIPQDLTKFIAEGTINQDILTDPNTVLRNAIIGQTITKTIVFTVSTNPTAPELGGGTANIAFLLGDPVTAAQPQGPNASAVQMSATFWIETVQHKIEVPPFKPGEPPLKLSPSASNAGAHVPVFEINPPHEITIPKTIVVNSIQVQYSQTVFLNFAGLTWPHVSVTTLVPSTDQTVPPSAWN